MVKKILLFLILLYTVGCVERNHYEVGLVTDQAMVVSAHPLASAVGAKVMEEGGNAVDAAIAVEFALAVVYPDAGNIGGGGFMIIRQDDGSTAALDYREEAPAAAHRDMYLNEEGEVIEGLSVKGHLAAGVPGTVAGMVQLHERYGSLPWEVLVRPAVKLAAEGFPLTEKEAEKLNEHRGEFLEYNTIPPDAYLDEDWQEGDTLKLPHLALTLERIMEKGRAGFYQGKTAELIVEEMKRGGGIITYQDLENYEAIWREPLTAPIGNYRVISMPPPSSGGIALIQLLRISEHYPLADWGWNTVESAHLMIEAERRVYADRAKHLGDPAFYDVPREGLLDSAYLMERMETFSLEEASDSDDISAGRPAPYESPSTTHYSIVDPAGNAVSATTTLNSTFGSQVVVAGAGFLLNNEMNDFSIKPGYPNQYGLIGGEANAIEPGKRMLSSMTPTILERQGELYMVVGSPGGSTIITTVYQTILNVIAHDFPMQGAVNARRFHHQWKPDGVLAEWGAFSFGEVMRLWFMGHRVVPHPWRQIGRTDAVLVLPDGRLEGGADPRGDDAAVGF